MAKPTLVCVVGTRPDAIKSAPVIAELRRFAESADTIIVSTGQHREMLAQALGAFGLSADVDLDIMQHGQTLSQITSRALVGIDNVLSEREPQFVLAQGDTTTTFVASLASFYRRIPFGHIEAGLRTPSVSEPFPEEFNRRTTSLISTHHYAPTRWSADNLRRESVSEEQIFVTGNTGIDAVLYVAESCHQEWYPGASRVVLLTTHRRENWGERQRAIARAAAKLVESFPDILLVVPMHKNPVVRDILLSELGSRDRVELIEPPNYSQFVKLMQRSTLILSDSGGVQEEAPSFGIPVLVLRETTERPEGVEAGAAVLVGADESKIIETASSLLTDTEARAKMSQARSPYGDGRASARIRYRVLSFLGISTPEVDDWT